MSYFEIVQYDYGRTYRGVVEDLDVSDCTAVLYVWDKDGTKIINGKSCSVAFTTPDTYIEYIPGDDDFDVTAGTYYGEFKLTKSGVIEHTFRFTWIVHEREPQ